MIIKTLTLGDSGYPEVLRHIPAPPERLHVSGAPLPALMTLPRVAIVGTRRITPYGREVTWRFAKELAERGIVIISGLALGVDARAHEAALEAGGRCIAVLPGPLENIVPALNRPLARRILAQGGALISEHAAGTPVYKHHFIQRNRLVCGLADALLITEAGEKSGSLHTANFAVEQGREVLVVPGNITVPGSVGVNNLLRQGQAAPATSYTDVLHALGLTDPQAAKAPKLRGSDKREQTLLDLLYQGVSDGSELLERSQLPVSEFNSALVMLEITGKVRPLGANHWSLR